jgi:aminoglycoside 2''-phosphotransferase
MNRKKEINSRIKQIKDITGLKINNIKTINTGAESNIIEVNDKWIFRFHKNKLAKEKTEKRLKLLISFEKKAPLYIPVPKYVESNFIAYKKIPGTPLYPTKFNKLNSTEKEKIAKQLGIFLKSLHNHKHASSKFNTGYLTMRKGDYNTIPGEIAKFLNNKEQKILKAKFEKIEGNPLNYKKPKSFVHGDLHFNNILWDPKKKSVTGIIDWAEIGRGLPAMDFFMLADFNNNSNDTFLKNILKYYGVKNNDLFFQIKESAIIDPINWFWSYYKEKNLRGIERMIKKIKKVLK